MKNLTVIGIVLLAISILLYYIQDQIFLKDFLSPLNIMGMLAGIGIGLIIGGIVGYISKGSDMKKKQKKAEFVQLQKEKLELEKQAAEIAIQYNDIKEKKHM